MTTLSVFLYVFAAVLGFGCGCVVFALLVDLYMKLSDRYLGEG